MPKGRPEFEPAKAFRQRLPAARPGANVVILTGGCRFFPGWVLDYSFPPPPKPLDQNAVWPGSLWKAICDRNNGAS